MPPSPPHLLQLLGLLYCCMVVRGQQAQQLCRGAIHTRMLTLCVICQRGTFGAQVLAQRRVENGLLCLLGVRSMHVWGGACVCACVCACVRGVVCMCVCQGGGTWCTAWPDCHRRLTVAGCHCLDGLGMARTTAKPARALTHTHVSCTYSWRLKPCYRRCAGDAPRVGWAL
jgi:hypothetical protein